MPPSSQGVGSDSDGPATKRTTVWPIAGVALWEENKTGRIRSARSMVSGNYQRKV